MSSPLPYTPVSDTTDLKQILDRFVAMWMRDIDMRPFTHVRAEFTISEQNVSGVEWKLIEADANTIYRQKMILMGDLSSYAVERCVRPFWRVGAERGQLTFCFNPPAVSLDLLDIQNTPLVAKVLIDGGKLS